MNFLNRANIIILLIRCIIRLLFYGVANKVPKNISRIIVVPDGKLGDVVCGTPVLHAIRKHLPNTHIIVAGNSKLHRPLLSDSGLVDDYIDFNSKNVIKEIKKHNIEAGFVTGPSFVPTALLYISGIPLIVAPKITGGFSPFETRPYKILQKFIKVYLYKMGKYAPRERLKCLEPLGIVSNDTKKHLGFSSTADKKINQFFIDNKIDLEKDFIVGISPSAGNKIKEWPVKRFVEIANYMALKYRTVIVIVGGPDNKEYSKQMKDYMNKNVKYIDTTGNSIDEMKAVISKLNLFISVDTGPIYIAEAFEIPTIDIIGPMDEKTQPPRGFIHRNVVPPKREQPELSVLNARLYNKKEATRQILSITVDAVLVETDKLINDLHTQK